MSTPCAPPQDTGKRQLSVYEARIAELLAIAPPLTPEQLARLRVLLRPRVTRSSAA